METNTQVRQYELATYAAAVQGSLMVWPLIGVLVAAFFASFHFDNPVIKGVAICLYVLGVFAVVGWQAKKAGVQPKLGPMPKALKKNMYMFWVVSTAMAGAALLLAFTTNFIVAGVVAGLAFTIAGVAYHQRSRSIISNLLAAA